MTSPTNNAPSVRILIQLLYASHVRPRVPDPRFLSAFEIVTQFSDEWGGIFEGENARLALSLDPPQVPPQTRG